MYQVFFSEPFRIESVSITIVALCCEPTENIDRIRILVAIFPSMYRNNLLKRKKKEEKKKEIKNARRELRQIRG